MKTRLISLRQETVEFFDDYPRADIRLPFKGGHRQAALECCNHLIIGYRRVLIMASAITLGSTVCIAIGRYLTIRSLILINSACVNVLETNEIFCCTYKEPQYIRTVPSKSP